MKSSQVFILSSLLNLLIHYNGFTQQVSDLRIFIQDKATIYIDDAKIGVIDSRIERPYIVQNLIAGKHTVEAIRYYDTDNYNVFKETVDIKHGAINSISITFQKIITHGTIKFVLGNVPKSFIKGNGIRDLINSKISEFPHGNGQTRLIMYLFNAGSWGKDEYGDKRYLFELIVKITSSDHDPKLFQEKKILAGKYNFGIRGFIAADNSGVNYYKSFVDNGKIHFGNYMNSNNVLPEGQTSKYYAKKNCIWYTQYFNLTNNLFNVSIQPARTTTITVHLDENLNISYEID